MARKSTKKVRASRIEVGMVLTDGGKVLDIRSQMIHTGWPAAPTTMITFVLEDGFYAAGSSEWVEIKREEA